MEIEINGQKYSLVKKRPHGSVSIYAGAKGYLRIGDTIDITPELRFHKKLLRYGFPIAQILEEGIFDGKSYYVEDTLGEEVLGMSFASDIQQTGVISKAHFSTYLELTRLFLQAQLHTTDFSHDEESFFEGVHFQYLISELPHLKDKIMQAFTLVKERVFTLPSVLTHGDLGPFNYCDKGIIDFGSNFFAPVGYDIVCSFYHTYNFPVQDANNYELFRVFDFTDDQRTEYFQTMNSVFVENRLPSIYQFLDDFAFCRTIWATTRMHKDPKIQKWRYDRFNPLLEAYIKRQPIIPLLIK